MKKERKIAIKYIEKEYIHTQNLVELLVKKYNIFCLKNETKTKS